MSTFQIQNSVRQKINSVEEWLELAPPAGGERQWRDGRSAKELAKAWFRDGVAAVPKEILAVMDTHEGTKDFVAHCAIAEKRTTLDDFPGNTRNNDVLITGFANHGLANRTLTIVAVEAKADESFGQTIGQYLRTIKKKPRSRVPKRIEMLSRFLFGKEPDEEICELRYQLLHGLAAAVIEANEQKASQAVFLVHEFWSETLGTAQLDRNHDDLERLIKVLLNNNKQDFTLSHEPVLVLCPKGVPGRPSVFIGKVRVASA